MFDVTHLPAPTADDWWGYNGDEIMAARDHVRSFRLTTGAVVWVRGYHSHPFKVFVVDDLGALEYQGEVTVMRP
jgi:hypothetical protein